MPLAVNGALPHSPDEVLDALPSYSGNDLGVTVSHGMTSFRLWSPEADSANVMIYPTDRNSAPISTIAMTRGAGGTWTASVPEELYGKFYTFA